MTIRVAKNDYVIWEPASGPCWRGERLLCRVLRPALRAYEGARHHLEVLAVGERMLPEPHPRRYAGQGQITEWIGAAPPRWYMEAIAELIA